jgi:hypothetical protein
MPFRGCDTPRVDIDSRVVDHGVDSADGVHLIRHASRLPGTCEIADHNPSRSASEVGHTARTRRVPRVQHHLMAA